MGVSFAIPIDVAMEVADQLQQKGYVARGWLGVLIQEVSKDLAESFGLNTPHGALVAQVIPGSPAEDAGLLQGDVITKYEGEVINRSSDLPHLVGRSIVGKKAKLDVVRAGKRKTLTVDIGELPTDKSNAVPVKTPKTSSNRFDIDVAELDDGARKRLQVSNGVIVTKVDQGPAYTAGIRPNDIISSINNQEVKTIADFNAIAKSLPSNRAIPVLIIRQGNPSFVVIKLQG